MLKLKQILFYTFSIYIGLITCSAGYAYNLPDLGNSSVTVLSTKENQQLIKAFKQVVLNHLDKIYDPIINDYLSALGEKLVLHSEHKKLKLHFFVINDTQINAFAGPGGYVGVNSGLILATTSESELAAVLAHEIAHITQHHLERSIEQAKSLNIPMTLAILAAIAFGTTAKSPAAIDAATGTAVASMAGGAQHMLNFVREDEAEADNIGMQTLFNAGFNPRAMPNFFARMQELNADYGQTPPPFLLTHPVTDTRIAEAENRVNQYPRKKLKNSRNYYLIKARLLALTKPDAKTYLENQMGITKATQQQHNALQYGIAICLLEDKEYQQALTISTKLTQDDKNNVLYQMFKAEILTKTQKYQKALVILEKTRLQHPGYYPLILQYAQTLITTKRYLLAENLLKNQISSHPSDETLYTLLSQAQAASGKVKAAYHTRAQLLKLEGYNSQAKALEAKSQ